jgi:hypothetical protein
MHSPTHEAVRAAAPQPLDEAKQKAIVIPPEPVIMEAI